jgi:Rrf2 family protein
MVGISRSVEYALIAVQHMDQDRGRLVSARDLSAHYSLPAGLIAKILQRLVASGLLESELGAGGGYRLVRDPDTISFLELSEAVEGRVRVAACDSIAGDCARHDHCTVAGPVHTLGTRILGLFADISVGSLLRSPAGKGASV